MSVEPPDAPEPTNSSTEAADEPPPSEASPSELLSEASLKFSEAGEYLASYLRSQVDRAKLTARDWVAWIILAFLALFLVASVLVTAVVFLLYGAAQGLTQVFGGRIWAGYLTTGGGLLLILSLGLKWERSLSKKRALKKRLKEYEEQLRHQTRDYGHNALERAAGAAPATEAAAD